MVTPPAVSVKMPVVSASSRMPARVSSSSAQSMLPPVLRASSIAYGPSAGLPMASDLAIVSGLTGRQTSVPAANGGAGGGRGGDRRAAERLGAVHHRYVAGHEPDLDELAEPARDLGELRAARDRA